jgi:hypothetical protein
MATRDFEPSAETPAYDDEDYAGQPEDYWVRQEREQRPSPQKTLADMTQRYPDEHPCSD